MFNVSAARLERFLQMADDDPVRPGLTAAIPMENPYRRATGLQLRSLWRIPTAEPLAYSCDPYGESLPQL